MFRALPFPIKAERSRNKERLEASLAGLCELELLKQRQECLVLGALCLGDRVPRGRPSAWGELDHGTRSHPSLQCTPWGIMASLEQQVAEVRVNPETKSTESTAYLEDSRLTTDGLVSRRDGPPEGACRPTALRSFSEPSQPPEAVSDGSVETCAGRAWPPDPMRASGPVECDFEEAPEDGEPTEEDYQQAQRVETYMMGLIHRRALPQRPSKPRTSLAHEARATPVARQGSLCRREDQPAQGTPEVADPEHYVRTGFGDDSLGTPGYHHHLQAAAQHQPGHYPRPKQPSAAPRSIPLPPQQHGSNSNSEPDSPLQQQQQQQQHFHHSYPPSPPPSSLLHPLQTPHARPCPHDEEEQQLVNAEYVPAQPCRASTRASAHHLPGPSSSPSHRGGGGGNGGLKPGRGTYSPERASAAASAQHPELQHARASRGGPRGGPRKCRASEDRGGGGGGGGGGMVSSAAAVRKQGKRACRSQSENSLQRVPPERKYHTAERDGAGSGSGGGGGRSGQPRSKKPQQPGSGSCRRWRSTLELSQDEAELQQQQPTAPPAGQREHCGRRARKTRPTHPPLAHPPHGQAPPPPPLHHHHHQVEYRVDGDQGRLAEDPYGPGGGESESSTSEADSPESSTLSSDTDGSGGLVWPQQLPPKLALPSPPATHGGGGPLQPKAFVKIKASHALKKKILRFRTGSLKVMTTV